MHSSRISLRPEHGSCENSRQLHCMPHHPRSSRLLNPQLPISLHFAHKNSTPLPPTKATTRAKTISTKHQKVRAFLSLPQERQEITKRPASVQLDLLALAANMDVSV